METCVFQWWASCEAALWLHLRQMVWGFSKSKLFLCVVSRSTKSSLQHFGENYHRRRVHGLSVDTTIEGVCTEYNSKGEVFRNSSRMHWSTSTRGRVGSSRNGLYFKRRTFHSHPQDWFFWIYSQSDEGSCPFVLVAWTVRACVHASWCRILSVSI